MKRTILIVVAALALAGMLFAQASGDAQSSTTTPQTAPAEQQSSPGASASANTSASPAASAVAEGTAINAELTRAIDAKKAKENDPVQAKVTQDVLAGGKVVLPRNSKLVGHLTQVKAGGKGEASSLGIAFDKAILKGGQELPVHGAIQALAPAIHMPSVPMAGGGGDDMSGGGAGPSGGYNSAGGGGMSGGSMRTGPAPAAGASPPAASPSGGVSSGEPQGPANAAGMTTSGQLTAASRGVMGMPGVTLEGGGASGTVLTNSKKTVKLDNGTQLVLRVTAQ